MNTNRKILEGVSLVVTLYNEAETLNDFLTSIKKQTVYPQEFVIVDGGSTDGATEIIKEFSRKNPELKIKLIVDVTCARKYSKAPIAKGRNQAIKNAKGYIIAVTDAGCILDKDWLKEITGPFFENEVVDVVGGYYKAIIKNKFQRRLSKLMIPKLEKINPKKFLPSSRSVAFKKSCWESVGGYPELTYTAEDTLFDLKLRSIGCKFIFNPKAVVYWELPKDYKELWRKVYLYGYGNGELGLFLIKHFFKIGLIFFPLPLVFLQKEEVVLKYIITTASSLGWISGFVKRVRKNFYALYKKI